MYRYLRPEWLLPTVALLVACGGEAPRTETPSPPPAAGAAAATPGAPLQPAAGRKVITVELMTDDQGNNRFNPAEFGAHQGDVLRFTLVTGVHNVHFVADSNRAATMPEASPLLQAPGQTFDIAVSWAPGRYYFQCDPHALLGMIGHVKVEKEDDD